MKQLSKPTKSQLILNMFLEVGDTATVEEVCTVTGIPNYDSLKVMLSYMRRAPHIPEENRVDIRIRNGVCTRVN